MNDGCDQSCSHCSGTLCALQSSKNVITQASCAASIGLAPATGGRLPVPTDHSENRESLESEGLVNLTWASAVLVRILRPQRQQNCELAACLHSSLFPCFRRTADDGRDGEIASEEGFMQYCPTKMKSEIADPFVLWKALQGNCFLCVFR